MGTVKSTLLLRWHRRLGLVAAILFVFSGLSGVLHPFMTRLQPAAAKLELELRVRDSSDAGDPAVLLANHNVKPFVDLRIVAWADNSYYQITQANRPQRRYFKLSDGKELPDGDRRYAEFLAREFIDEPVAAVRSAHLIDAFDWEYPRINRLLPVWRIEFARGDGLRAYVDTRTGRLGTLVDHIKALSSTEFAILHRWQWLDSIAPRFTRMLVVALLLTSALVVTLSGTWLYIVRWGEVSRQWNLRRVHRLWGVSISLASCLFVLSGGYHLLHIGVLGDAGERRSPAPSSFTLGQLKVSPRAALEKSDAKSVSAISLVEIEGEPYYRIQPAAAHSKQFEPALAPHGAHIPHGRATAGHVAPLIEARFVSASDGNVLADGPRRYALDIAARAYSSQVIAGPTAVRHFDGEYGFAFKRLPVQQLLLANGTALYIDPADGTIAAAIEAGDRIEGWVFGNIHKFDWLVPFIGTDARDGIAALLALLLAGVALLGVKLWFAQRARPQ